MSIIMIKKKLCQISRSPINIIIYSYRKDYLYDYVEGSSAAIKPFDGFKRGLSVYNAPIKLELLLSIAKNNNYYRGSTLKFLSLFYIGLKNVSRNFKRKIKDL